MQWSVVVLALAFLGWATVDCRPLAGLQSLPGPVRLNAETGCTHPIYCQGPLLAAVQNARVFNDSKTFVDMPLRASPEEVLAAFARLGPNITSADVRAFVFRYFAPAGSDVISFNPPDWKPGPSFLSKLSDPMLAKFGASIHWKWRDLVRQYNRSAWLCPSPLCASALDAPYPFVVAGGRFREYYYWDSYWIVRGLLVSEMPDSARGHLRNMLGLVGQYGFVPNGARVYYLNRSQPPLLSLMIGDFYAATRDSQFLASALPLLDKEYSFWMSERAVAVGGGVLNLFNVSNSTPRPESYFEDFHLAKQFASQQEQAQFYKDMATGAETGWDYSSRWFGSKSSLLSIRTSAILPVDLNAIMYRVERILSFLNGVLGNNERSEFYAKAASLRSATIARVLWNDTAKIWNDVLVENPSISSQGDDPSGVDFYPSGALPLWAGAAQFPGADPKATLAQIFAPDKGIVQSLNYIGGVPSSLYGSGQQWDFPNAWPVHQFFLAEALLESEGLYPPAGLMARSLIQRWVSSNFCSWNATGAMFEKYNATVVGAAGGGGEYEVQEGFGWTNGVLLDWLQRFPTQLSAPTSCPTNLWTTQRLNTPPVLAGRRESV